MFAETGLGFIGLTNSEKHAAIIASSLQSRIETTKITFNINLTADSERAN